MLRVEENAFFSGTLGSNGFLLNDGCVSDKHVAAGANVDTAKLKHRHALHFFQNGNMVSASIPIFIGYGATNKIISIKAGSIVKPGAATTFTADLQRAGVSVLTAPISLSNANTNRVPVQGVIASANGAANDWYDLVLTLTGVNPGSGFGCVVIIDEDPN